MTLIKRIILTTLAFILAAYSPAPIGDRPPDFKPTPEQSQEQVAEQQRLQKVVGPVGNVETDTDRLTSDPQTSDSNAALNVSAANQQNAVNNLRQANTDLKGGKSQATKTVIWGLLFLAAGLGIAISLRSWAAKNAPPFPAG